MSEKIVKCPICGKPYFFYYYYADDQSACVKCRTEARKNMERQNDILPKKDWQK